MIGPSGAVQVMLATRPVDFRKGMDGLAMLVREELGADPFCGTVFAFRSKREHCISFYIRFGVRGRRLPLASLVRATAADRSEMHTWR